MIIYGAGGHAKVILDTLKAFNKNTPITAVFDDDESKKDLLTHPVQHHYSPEIAPEYPLIIAIGNNKIRKNIAAKISHVPGNAIHPHASVSSKAKIGPGTVVLARSIVQVSVKLGKHVIINSGAIIEHDGEIGDFVHIAPGAKICGEVKIGEGSFIGAGAIILPGITIGKWTEIGAGSVVTKDVPDHASFSGIPAREQNKDWKKHNEKIRHSPPHIGNKEIQSVNDALKTNWIAPLGHALDSFELKLSRQFNNLPVLALNSGTAALHLALILAGVETGDEVICPDFTFAAVANPICYQKARPVFVDCDELSWNMASEFIEKAIEDRLKNGKRPKALIMVHNYGVPASIDQIRDIAHHYQIKLIEDAAEAIGSKYQSQPAGTFGEMGIISFNGNKIITTGGGGALIAKDPALIEQAAKIANQGREKCDYYLHQQLGYNYRMSNIAAAIGEAQMESLQEKVQKRRGNFEYYKKSLAADFDIHFQKAPEGTFANRWLTPFCLNDKLLPKVTPEKLFQKLADHGIELKYLWYPLHLQPFFKQFPYYGNETGYKLFTSGLTLPSGSNLTREDLENITGLIREALIE